MKELCPAEALHEECGVFGIYDSTGKTNMVSAVYSALYALQHRGQESCGIALNPWFCTTARALWPSATTAT